MSGLLALGDAQNRLLELAPRMPATTVAVDRAVGRYLATNVIASRTQPPANLSAMDGYALCGPGPWTIVGESRAGHGFRGVIRPGQAVKISTGAKVPPVGDRILLKEDAVLDGDVLAVSDQASPRHIRPYGFDFNLGETVLQAGTRVGPGQLALALSAGKAELEVARPPVVAIIDSGDELGADPSDLAPNQIPASNGAMIAAMLHQEGCETVRLGPVPDDHDALAKALVKAEGADIVVTSGGASVGDHDLIQDALRRWGAELAFWKVAIKPGKPLMVAKRGSQVILGLPGNPVSSFVTCFLFALPLVRAAMGVPAPLPSTQSLVAAQDLPAVGKRREFLRGVSDGTRVRLATSQDSSALRALASANCLIERPEGSPAAREGEPVPVYNLQNG
ncbi:MAG: molybdopterin molybdotransferase MoeA [Pseudomonadota bacterium]